MKRSSITLLIFNALFRVDFYNLPYAIQQKKISGRHSCIHLF